MGILERWKYFTNFTFIPSRNKINKNFRSCRLWRDFWEEKQMNLFTDLVGLAKDTNFTCNSFQLYLKDPFIFFKSNILNKYSRFWGKREKCPLTSVSFYVSTICYICTMFSSYLNVLFTLVRSQNFVWFISVVGPWMGGGVRNRGHLICEKYLDLFSFSFFLTLDWSFF